MLLQVSRITILVQPYICLHLSCNLIFSVLVVVAEVTV